MATTKVQTTINEQYVRDIAEANGYTVKVSDKGNWWVIESDDFTVKLSIEGGWWNKPKKLRIFVDGEEKVDFSEAYAMADQENGLRRGINDAMDKAFDKLNRQVVKNQKAVLLEAIESNDIVRNIIGGAKFGFWKTAGCGCGCSSGWIAETHASAATLDMRYASPVTQMYVWKKD